MNPISRHFHQPVSPNRRNPRLRLERLEDRIQPADVRSIDGTGNNPYHDTWGSAGVDLLRLAPPAYGDGISTPGGANRPSARAISNAVADQGDQDIVNNRLMSAMVYAWGQFIDHDLDLTPDADPAQPFNVKVPTSDPYFDPLGTGTQVISLNRSQTDPATGTAGHPLQQVNVITAWLDGSMVYGSDTTTALKLRTLKNGRLKTSDNDMLPYNDLATFPTGILPMANAAGIVPEDQLFAAGDVRANENVELLSLQTLFVREHNRLADAIHQANHRLSDEQVYQQARAQVIGEIQSITYNQWLPSLLGSYAMEPYYGYNWRENPGIANEFSTASFRFGHSLLGNDVEFLGNDGLPVAKEVPLSQAFFNPPLLAANGIDSVLKYLSSDPSSEVDTKVVGSVRNFLFGPPGAGGLDLASLNIQRGRDHGLADYNTMRAYYGLRPVTSFNQITSDPALAAKLKDLYGSVKNIDAWVGGLAEDHVSGGSTGPLIRAVLADQFGRLRDGDRFWYERTFYGQQLDQLEHTTLADIIRRNTSLTNLQQNLFYFRASINGTVYNDANHSGQADRGEPGLANVTVELIDTSDNSVVAMTHTDRYGHYQFGVDDGLGTGRYRVVQVPPAGWVQTTAAPPALAITRGETFINGVDFGDYHPTPPSDSPVWLPPPEATLAGPSAGEQAQSQPATDEPPAPMAAPLPAGPTTTATVSGNVSHPDATDSDAMTALLGVDLTAVDFL